MEIWQLYLVGYGVALLCWLMIIVFTLLISIFSKRNLLLGFVALTGIIAVLLGLAAGIGDLIFVIWLFQNNQIFWAIVLILIGFGAISFIAQLLSYPFIIILSGLTTWCDMLLGIESEKPKKITKGKEIKQKDNDDIDFYEEF